MRDDTITKMYAGLTNKERAALAFDYLMRADDVECKRIEAAMPEQYCIGAPLEYRRMLLGLTQISALYALEYWRNVAGANICLAGYLSLGHKVLPETGHLTDTELLQHADYQRWRAIFKMFEQHEVMLLSIEAAIDELCAERGINPAAIRKLAGERHYTFIGIPPDGQVPEPNAAMVAEIKAIWSKLLD